MTLDEFRRHTADLPGSLVLLKACPGVGLRAPMPGKTTVRQNTVLPLEWQRDAAIPDNWEDFGPPVQALIL